MLKNKETMQHLLETLKRDIRGRVLLVATCYDRAEIELMQLSSSLIRAIIKLIDQ